MTLYLAEKALHLTIPDEVWLQDSQEVLDPLFNASKVGERTIINAKIDREEGDDIDHCTRHVIWMTKSWIKKPFLLDPVSKIVTFHAHARPERCKGRKVTVPTFTLKSPIRPEIVYQLDRPVGYYHPPEKKGKRKRASPQRIQEEHVPYQQREPSPQRSHEVGDTQIHVDVQLPPTLLSQPEEGEIPETSIPPWFEECISLVTP